MYVSTYIFQTRYWTDLFSKTHFTEVHNIETSNSFSTIISYDYKKLNHYIQMLVFSTQY